MMNSDMRQHVTWFRGAAPYINAHRGKTFVLYLSSQLLLHPNFENIMNDITLLHSLGVRLILVHGASEQVSESLREAGIASQVVDGVRVTDMEALQYVEEVIGRLRIKIEARLSMGLINSPMHLSSIRIMSGNFVKARPLGIRDGIDFSAVAEGFEMMGVSSVLYPALKLQDLVLANVVVILLGILTSLLPAWRASRYRPVEAIARN